MISVSTDWLYPPHLSEEIVTALHSSGKDVLYTEVMSGFGYDGSLLEHDQMNYLIGRFLTPLMVADTMICHPPTPFASTSIRAAAAAMIDHEVKPLPSVLRVNGTICGIVTSWGTL
jgi:homoserine O-acetyltransferase